MGLGGTQSSYPPGIVNSKRIIGKYLFIRCKQYVFISLFIILIINMESIITKMSGQAEG